jgi:hypothetical protein
MITLQGKSYYEITELDPDEEGYTINPFNSDGTLIPRIQVNFNLNDLGQQIFTLPSLGELNGNWNIEIIISVSISDLIFRGKVTIVTQGYVNGLLNGISSLSNGQSVSFRGTSLTSYIATGVFRPENFLTDPIRDITE